LIAAVSVPTSDDLSQMHIDHQVEDGRVSAQRIPLPRAIGWYLFAEAPRTPHATSGPVAANTLYQDNALQGLAWTEKLKSGQASFV